MTLKAPLNGALEELRAPVEAVSQSVNEDLPALWAFGMLGTSPTSSGCPGCLWLQLSYPESFAWALAERAGLMVCRDTAGNKGSTSPCLAGHGYSSTVCHASMASRVHGQVQDKGLRPIVVPCKS